MFGRRDEKNHKKYIILNSCPVLQTSQNSEKYTMFFISYLTSSVIIIVLH